MDISFYFFDDLESECLVTNIPANATVNTLLLSIRDQYPIKLRNNAENEILDLKFHGEPAKLPKTAIISSLIFDKKLVCIYKKRSFLSKIFFWRNDIASRLASIENTVKTTKEDVKTTKEDVKNTNEKIDTTLRSTYNISLRELDAYYNMTETSAGKNKNRQEACRKNYYDKCGITDERNVEGKQQSFCVMTGKAGKLKLAHLVPASASPYIRNCLKLPDDENGIWSIRNVLLLSWNIENAFDRKKLSFIPHPLQQDQFVMKIWDDAIRDTLLWDEAMEGPTKGDNTIGFYANNNHMLQLTMLNGTELRPFKRCLSYQAYLCYLHFKESNATMVPDFASDIGQPYHTMKNDLLVYQKSLIKDIANEMEEEAAVI